MSQRELWLTIAGDRALRQEWNPLLPVPADLEQELIARGFQTRSKQTGRRLSRIRRVPGSGTPAGR